MRKSDKPKREDAPGYVIVITRANLLGLPLASLMSDCSVYSSAPNQVVVQRGAAHAYIVQDQTVRADYQDEPALPETERESPNFFLLEFNDPVLLRDVILQLATVVEGWVDDDHGTIVPLRTLG